MALQERGVRLKLAGYRDFVSGLKQSSAAITEFQHAMSKGMRAGMYAKEIDRYTSAATKLRIELERIIQKGALKKDFGFKIDPKSFEADKIKQAAEAYEKLVRLSEEANKGAVGSAGGLTRVVQALASTAPALEDVWKRYIDQARTATEIEIEFKREHEQNLESLRAAGKELVAQQVSDAHERVSAMRAEYLMRQGS